MAKHGKKYLEAAKLIDSEATYEPSEAVELVKRQLLQNSMKQSKQQFVWV